MIPLRLPLAGFLLLGALLAGAVVQSAPARQSAASPEEAESAADPIVGAWKLNIEKSTRASVESELLTISKQAGQFQIVIQAMYSNEYNPHYLVTTDMKGAISNLVLADGRPMADKWRVTRSGPNEFVIESIGQFGGSKRYTVSDDRKTMTMRELRGSGGLMLGKTDSNGVLHRVEQQVLVFERISDSEGRAMAQKMSDEDAAQKARAAEKAAALAAVDAAACDAAPGQPGAAVSISDEKTWQRYICREDNFTILSPRAPKRHSFVGSKTYDLFGTTNESIAATLSVSDKPVVCADWFQWKHAMVTRPLPQGEIHMTTETTFQGRTAFETVHRIGNGPQYAFYDLEQCSTDRIYSFHARWPSDHAKPDVVGRIFDSFRLLADGKK